jgi:hypothetical protein
MVGSQSGAEAVPAISWFHSPSLPGGEVTRVKSADVTRPHCRAPGLYWNDNRVFMHAWR